MTPHRNHWRRGLQTTGLPREHVSHVVNGETAAQILHFRREPMPDSRVIVCKAEPGHAGICGIPAYYQIPWHIVGLYKLDSMSGYILAILMRRAPLTRFVERLPQSVLVDPEAGR